MKHLVFLAAMAYNRLQKEVLHMSQAVNVNFRMDADLKKSMEQTCSELGMSMTTAFTIFAKKVSREKRIPFDVSLDSFYTESNRRYLEKASHEVAHELKHFLENEPKDTEK